MVAPVGTLSRTWYAHAHAPEAMTALMGKQPQQSHTTKFKAAPMGKDTLAMACSQGQGMVAYPNNLLWEKKPPFWKTLIWENNHPMGKQPGLGLCKPVPKSTRSTDERNAKRVSTPVWCSNRSSKSRTEASSNWTDPYFRCLELWIRHRFTEILSLKKIKNKKTHQWSPCCMLPFFFFFSSSFCTGSSSF